jgi:hypothetical protein
MKIGSILMAILTVCTMLMFCACDGNGSKDNTNQLLPLLLLGGTKYTIGETGPSGVGTVFYISHDGLHGLEAAPQGWYFDSAPNDPTTAWSTINSTAIGSKAQGTAIGKGLKNTNAIISQNSGAASAAKLCEDYAGGGMTDWFLPSKDELNQLYLQASFVTGLSSSYYWSSSEFDASNAWKQHLATGDQGSDAKSLGYYVRPIRAF